MSKPYLKILNETDANKCNCVLYARSRVPQLPFELFTMADKKKIVNQQNPKINDVAIMNIGLPAGHVGIVVFVGRTHLTIQEANYKTCKITERHDTPVAFRIIGYYRPA